MVGRAFAASLGPGFRACLGAFEEEFDHVYRTIRRLGVPPTEAEDLVQEVFLVLWRKWGEFQQDRPVRPWLVGIAHRVVLRYRRKRGTRQMVYETVERVDESPGPEEQLVWARGRELALRALARLPEAQRSIVIKHDLEGISIREIADELSLPLFTAAARLRRGRLRFAKTVKQLQRSGAHGMLLLSPQVILERERQVPRLAPAVRERMRARLLADAARTPPPPPTRTAGRSLPWPALLPLAAALVAAGVLLALGPGRQDPASPPAAADHEQPRETPVPRRRLPPRLLPGSSPAPAPGSAQSPPAEGLNRGLLAHWRFEDGPGSLIARDASGHGRPCLLHDLDTGAAWVEGAVGGGLDLQPTGWLECPLPEVRAGVPLEMTVAAWIKHPRWRRAGEFALFTRHAIGLPNRYLFWFGLRDQILTVASGGWVGWTSVTMDSVERWTHVAFAHGGHTTRLYVDGVRVTTRPDQIPRGDGLVQTALTVGATPFRQDGRVRHHFGGLIDEAVVYDRALTDAEIAELSATPRELSVEVRAEAD